MITIEEFDNWVKTNIDDRKSMFRKNIKHYGWSVYGRYISDKYELSFINSNDRMDNVFIEIEFLDPFRNPCSSFEEPFNLGIYTISPNQISMGKIVTDINDFSSYLFNLLGIFLADVIQKPYDAKEDIIDGLLGEVVF